MSCFHVRVGMEFKFDQNYTEVKASKMVNISESSYSSKGKGRAKVKPSSPKAHQ